jgi:hypothetical protein
MNYYSLISEKKFKLKVPHYIGDAPVTEEAKKNRTLLPIAGVVVIEKRQGAIYLERYNHDGEWGGNTWHENIEDAKYQAEFEYGDSLIQWVEIPESIEDPVKYALEASHKN